MKLGILPRKSNSVCILTAAPCFRQGQALVVRKCAHGKTARQRSMVVDAAASRHRSGVKRAHRLPVRSAEAEMCTGNRSSQFRLAGDGKLDAERSRRRAVIGASAVTEIDDAHEPSGRSA